MKISENFNPQFILWFFFTQLEMVWVFWVFWVFYFFISNKCSNFVILKTEIMYYEEKVINGVLSHRGLPDGKWIPFTPKELTDKLKCVEVELDVVKEELSSTIKNITFREIF